MSRHQHSTCKKRVFSATGSTLNAGIDLIYCANGNPQFAQIAVDAGFLYGAQLPGRVSQPLYFADQDWKKPNRTAYMAALAKYRPFMASVLDFERMEQLSDVLEQAEEVSQFVEVVMLIPKVFGGIKKLPHMIGGKPIRLGYSVPTQHGGTDVPVWEFSGWPVHLLGGSPQSQMRLAPYFDVKSVDGNMMQKMAVRFCAFWDDRKTTRRGYWPMLNDYDGCKWGDGSVTANAPAEAFRRSCVNIMAAWRLRFSL